MNGLKLNEITWKLTNVIRRGLKLRTGWIRIIVFRSCNLLHVRRFWAFQVKVDDSKVLTWTVRIYENERSYIKLNGHCNLKSKTVHICLPFLSMGTKYACNHRNLCWRYSSRNYCHVTLGLFSTLQAYLVRFEKACNHQWSVLDFKL